MAAAAAAGDSDLVSAQGPAGGRRPLAGLAPGPGAGGTRRSESGSARLRDSPGGSHNLKLENLKLEHNHECRAHWHCTGPWRRHRFESVACDYPSLRWTTPVRVSGSRPADPPSPTVTCTRRDSLNLNDSDSDAGHAVTVPGQPLSGPGGPGSEPESSTGPETRRPAGLVRPAESESGIQVRPRPNARAGLGTPPQPSPGYRD
jgi:hypothetical protein